MKATRTPTLPPPRIPEEEQTATREVLRLIAKLHPLRVVDGRIVIPAGATEELRERIRRFEPELLFAYGYESGDVWGRAVPGCPYNTEAWPFPKEGPTPAGHNLAEIRDEN